MEIRWVAFLLVCIFLAFLALGFGKLAKKSTLKDRNHNLEIDREKTEGSSTLNQF